MLEHYKFWNHLSLAKLVKGTYTNLAYTIPYPGVNVPRVAGFDNAGTMVIYRDSAQAMFGNNIYGKADQHVIITAGFNNQWGLYDGFIDSTTALQIDIKLDDGVPGLGFVFFGNGISTTGCTLPSNQIAWTSSTLPTGYDLTSNKPGCVFFKWLDI